MAVSYYIPYTSPVGVLYLVAQGRHLTGVVFAKNWKSYRKKLSEVEQSELPVLQKTQKQLEEYFQGKRRKFDLPMHLSGTPFQTRTWKSLSKIPFAKTKSYKEQAVLVGSPNAVRAIGRTNGLNPLSIVLPCHRVIGSNGSLTGYGGGLGVKQYLLELEKRHAERVK